MVVIKFLGVSAVLADNVYEWTCENEIIKKGLDEVAQEVWETATVGDHYREGGTDKMIMDLTLKRFGKRHVKVLLFEAPPAPEPDIVRS